MSLLKEKVVAMVLSSATIGEYDKRVVLLSRELGRISAFARGARRPKSQLAAVTETFCFGEFFIYSGRDYYTIEEVRIANYFPELRTDLVKLYMGMYFCEVADYFTREGLKASDELELIYRALMALIVGDISDDLIRRIYELRFLAVSGYAPYYDASDECWHDDSGAWKLSPTASYAVGQVISRDMSRLFGFSVSEEVMAELDRCIGTFFKKNTDKEFATLATLKQFMVAGFDK